MNLAERISQAIGVLETTTEAAGLVSLDVCLASVEESPAVLELEAAIRAFQAIDPRHAIRLMLMAAAGEK